MAYIANTPEDVRVMLGAIGLESLDQLFDMIPPEYRLKRPLAIPEALGEMELTAQVGSLIGRNAGGDLRPCFLGAGSYDHFIPAVVDNLAARGEFYTAYTPYQAEASQGTLQATFEYQTLLTQLTGMDVANASLYDGGSAVAEAMLMALGVTRRQGRLVFAGSVHPEYRQVVATYAANLAPELVTVPPRGGRMDVEALAAAITEDTAAVVVQQPNFFGQLEDVAALVDAAHQKGAVAILSVDPISLGLLRRPGSYGADIVVAEGQSLGNPMAFGGPYLGMMACREEYVRKMPGRIVGQTTDRNGKRCWVLTLQTREQHIRREKATSNICTNQGLLALRASIYLAAVGPTGLRQAAELSTRKAHYAAEQLAGVSGLSVAFDGPFFKEFVIRSKQDPVHVLAEVGRLGFHGGIALGRWYPELADCILVAVTEKRTKDEIDGLADAYERQPLDQVRSSDQVETAAESSIGRSPCTSSTRPPCSSSPAVRGRATAILPKLDVPERPLDELSPAAHRAAAPPPLPELSELDIVRHYTNLSTLNMSIDANFYPLGSCTMKYNPKRNERLAAMPGLGAQHPYQDESTLQGLLAILYELQEFLAEIAGLHAVSLQPAAGAQGELAALLVAAAYFRDRGEKRTKVLIPDSAHGTNPASAHLAGFEAVTIRSDTRGLVDLDDFRSKLDDQTAVFMITNPNTVGLFDPQVGAIARLLHERGALLYLDGANMNAILGAVRPGDMGVDLMHYNPHKTFSGPHGGGGPGAGPIAVRDRLAPYLPAPIVARNDDGSYRLDFDYPKSIGRVRAFFGNTGVLFRAYCYIRSQGPDGLKAVSEHAVLNANYLMSLVRDVYPVPFGERCMHEFVSSARGLAREKGIRAMDVAKRLLDHNVHAPTVYFPLIVPEALMIEPTETEGRETLEAFANVLLAIAEEDAGHAARGAAHDADQPA